jgi:hypothetical protein
MALEPMFSDQPSCPGTLGKSQQLCFLTLAFGFEGAFYFHDQGREAATTVMACVGLVLLILVWWLFLVGRGLLTNKIYPVLRAP